MLSKRFYMLKNLRRLLVSVTTDNLASMNCLLTGAVLESGHFCLPQALR